MNQNHAPVNNNADDHVEFIVEEQFERPTKFSPDWPPKNRDKPLPNLHVKCAKTFKKVKWPPVDDDEEPEVEPPPQVQLLDEMPLNDTAMRPCGTYKLASGVYAEEPAEIPSDVWPPPEKINTDERTIHDPTRKKRVIRDYTVYFDKNKTQDTSSGYRVPPGTLHVYSTHPEYTGVLEFDTPDLGSGRPKDGQPI